MAPVYITKNINLHRSHILLNLHLKIAGLYKNRLLDDFKEGNIIKKERKKYKTI